MGGSCSPCCPSCCDRGKTKSTPSQKTEIGVWQNKFAPSYLLYCRTQTDRSTVFDSHGKNSLQCLHLYTHPLDHLVDARGSPEEEGWIREAMFRMVSNPQPTLSKFGHLTLKVWTYKINKKNQIISLVSEAVFYMFWGMYIILIQRSCSETHFFLTKKRTIVDEALPPPIRPFVDGRAGLCVFA